MEGPSTAPARRRLALGDGLRQVLVAAGAVAVYELLRRLMEPDWPLALRHAHEIASLERLAGIGVEAGVQRLFLRVPDLVAALNLFYLAGHLVLTAAFFVWLHRRSRPAFALFRDGFLVASALALAVHRLYPAAPPRLAGLGIEDTLRALSGIDIGSPASSPFSNPVAAMPSLHAGFAFGVGAGLLLHARSRRWRAAGLAYPPLVVLTIVVTGNHFLLDAVAGAAVVLLCLAAAGAARAGTVVRLSVRRGVEQPGSSPGS